MGLTGIKLTGGEPLLHPQIHDILDFIRSEELRLTVETNGVLCTPELVQKISECKKPFVSVSLDGADAETHEWVRGVDGCFAAAIDGIRNLVEIGLKPQIIMTIMRRNKDHMEALVHMAESLGAGSVKFNIMQPTTRGEKMHQAGENLSIEELVEIGRWVERTLSDSTSLRLYFDHPMAFRPLSKMFGDNDNGCGVCGILGILGVLSNGSYALCGIGENVPGLVFGDATSEPLKDIWHNVPVLIELREGIPHRFQGICTDCLMKCCCLGRCIAQNYYLSEKFWASYWYCEAAQTKGLFPNTRVRPRILLY